MSERKIVYLPHPVSPETKAKHLAAGERIMDIRFAPQGYQAAPKPAPEPMPEPAPIAEPENVVEEKPKRRGRPKFKK